MNERVLVLSLESYRIAERRRARVAFGVSYVCSVGIHAGIIGLLLLSSSLSNAGRAYDVIPVAAVQSDRKTRVIWYSLRDAPLPAIRPSQTASHRTEPRVTSLLDQRIVTAPAKKRGEQFVSVPAPEIKVRADLRAPNMLALPTRDLPAPPKPRVFVSPSPRPAQPIVAPKIELPDAPRPAVAAAELRQPKILPGDTVKLPAAPEPRRFIVPPARPVPAVESPKLILPEPPASDIAAPAELKQASLLAQQRTFVPPAPMAVRSIGAATPIAEETVPSVSATVRLDATGTLRVLQRPTAVPPAPDKGNADPTSGNPLALPGRDRVGQTGTVTAASISAHPANSSRIPEYSQQVAISAGKDSGKQPSAELPSSDGKLMMPGVSVSDPAGAATGVRQNVPSSLPTPGDTRAPRNFGATPVATLSTPLWPQSRALQPVIESRFRGRVVYVTVAASPMPVAPDWVVWFGEQDGSAGTTTPVMRPPMLIDAATLRDVPFAPAASKIYVAGVIRRDGAFVAVATLQGDPERLRPWIDALRNVRFSPAVRNGVPVSVDAILEIPITQPSRLVRK